MSERKRRRRGVVHSRKKRRNTGLIAILVGIVVVFGIAGAVLLMKYGPTYRTGDLKGYYGITGDDDLAIVIDDTNLEVGGRIIDGIPYIEYSVLRTNLNGRFYWDANEGLLLYTLPNGTVRVEAEQNSYTVTDTIDTKDYVIFKQMEDTAYVALDFVKQYTNMEYAVHENPNRAMIVTGGREIKTATIKKDTEVRYQAGVRSPVLAEVSKGDKVTMIEVLDNWEKVCTSDGFIGYVKAKALGNEETETTSGEGYQEQVYTNIAVDYTINMGWDNVSNETANTYVADTIGRSKGLTTISPTWYNIADSQGNLASISSSDYVVTAHNAGVDVWPTLRDFQGGTDSMESVYEVLSYTSKRGNLISQVIADALDKDVDGINLDFELIDVNCGVHYIQFVRELSVACRQNQLVLSVDNYVPQPYNEHYNIEEQGKVADYVVMMGYDEHTNASETTGSVASLPYVSDGLQTILEQVPSEKVISGVPFFTRIWTVAQNGAFTSEALGMEDAISHVGAAGATASYDEETGQNYAEWVNLDGSTSRVWLEDYTSQEARLKMMQENNLAGMAAWRLGFESSEIWDLITQYIQN